MPIIDMPVDMLLSRIAGDGDAPPMSVKDLAEILPKLGCEVDEVAATREYLCRTCGKIYDRTEAQGPPLSCSNCGADFRASPEGLEDLGPNTVLKLDMLAVRPDIFDPGGMARYIRGYLGIQTGLPEYVLSAARIKVQVDPALSNEDSFRPYIACAVVRNVGLDNNTIKMVMNLQEDLHWALGRDRKLASIGVYDLDTLKGDTFHYDAVDPDGLRFVPLGFSPDDFDTDLTPREILEKHKTGQAYAHLLAPLKKYPLLRDGEGTVLSMPPIINSESTRVTMNTRQFFIDVTGLSQRVVDRALNIVVTSLKETMPQIEVECVMIESPGRWGGRLARHPHDAGAGAGGDDPRRAGGSGDDWGRAERGAACRVAGVHGLRRGRGGESRAGQGARAGVSRRRDAPGRSDRGRRHRVWLRESQAGARADVHGGGAAGD